MEYKHFKVTGLFGLYNHQIDFTSADTLKERASIIMLYGKNGIGKTTVLRMIEGLMRLDFSVFREVSFDTASLKFSNNQIISVTGKYNENKTLEYLEVKYKKIIVKLHPKKIGPLNTEEEDIQDKIQDTYYSDLERFSFEFIDTERLLKKNLKEEMIHKEKLKGKLIGRKEVRHSSLLSNKVKMFITDSQVYSARYFKRDEPELFEKILSSIENTTQITTEELKTRIRKIVKNEKDFQIERIGIAQEIWDKKKLNSILDSESKKEKPSIHKLTVINSYLEVLESRNNEKINLAERLLVFEEILNDFLLDKKITVSIENGFIIHSSNGDKIHETKLSTGEYHLLYLTVLALCTRVKGTVIAIDEPEMSMHISWQNKLVKALLKISSKANPQFILATHSPDIAANYGNSFKTTTYER